LVAGQKKVLNCSKGEIYFEYMFAPYIAPT